MPARSLCLRSLSLALLLCLAPPAQADETLRQAKEAFDQGRQAYYEGRYPEAVAAYQRAMALKHSPKLYYNIGLAYEKMGELARSKEAFERYLAEDPAAPNAAEVQKRIETLALQLPAAGAQPTQPPATEPGAGPGAAEPFQPLLPGASPAREHDAAAEADPWSAQVTVDIFSAPRQAEVFINGQRAGLTPLRLNLARDQSYTVTMEKGGYQPEERSLTADRRQSLHVDLKLTAAGRQQQMTRTEWLGLEVLAGLARTASQALAGQGGLLVQALTFKWPHFCWTLLEAGGAGDAISYATIGTRASYPLYFGPRGEHQLRIGLGVHASQYELTKNLVLAGRETNQTRTARFASLTLSPVLEYRYLTAGWLFFGGGLRVTRHVAPAPQEELFKNERPLQVFFTGVIGWASRR